MKSLYILYGSETGYAEDAALRIFRLAFSILPQSYKVELQTMNQFDVVFIVGECIVMAGRLDEVGKM